MNTDFGALAARELKKKYEELCSDLRLAERRVEREPMNAVFKEDHERARRAVAEIEKEVMRHAW